MQLQFKTGRIAANCLLILRRKMRDGMKEHLEFMALVCCVFAFLTPLSAQSPTLTYTYVGNKFTNFTGTDQCPPQCNVYGSFTIPNAPLQPYPGEGVPTAVIHNPISLTFTDGLNTITLGNASEVDIELALNSAGYFDPALGWCIYVGEGRTNVGNPLLTIDTIFNGSGCVPTNDQTYMFLQDQSTVEGDAIVTDNPGTWVVAETPFSAFQAALAVEFGSTPNTDAFQLLCDFTLGQSTTGINPLTQPVTLQVGDFSTIIPPGSFKAIGSSFYFSGTVLGGTRLEIGIVPTGAKRYDFAALAQEANLTGTANPVNVTLTIGDNTGAVSVNAYIVH